MAKMKAAMAAVLVLEKEGVTQAFGVPGAAINPLYAALRERQSIAHILARHVEGASHMAEGYTRAKAGNIGVNIGVAAPMAFFPFSGWKGSFFGDLHPSFAGNVVKAMASALRGYREIGRLFERRKQS